ncbi:hypothetical protein ACRALDRAFT_1068593 [Sodiomyces alcalophilus JCM 7366]|uniref:uncharacterized protein n=1 Tax=Sodiomyces alcalophilus JCM 7366 TaxID=591952 RepID=UPI0039B5BBE8
MSLAALFIAFAQDFSRGFFHGAFWVPLIACIGGIIRGGLRSMIMNTIFVKFENRLLLEDPVHFDLLHRGLQLSAYVMGELVPSFLLARAVPGFAAFLEIAVAPDPTTSETCAFVVIFVIMCVQQSVQELAWRIDDRFTTMKHRLAAMREQMLTHPRDWEVDDGFRGLGHHTPAEYLELMDRREDDANRKIQQIQHTMIMLNTAHSCVWETHIFLSHCIHDRVRTRWPNQIWDILVLPKSVREQRPEDTSVLGRAAYWLLCGLRLIRSFVLFPCYDGYQSNGSELVLHPLMLFLHWDAMNSQKQALGGRVFFGKKTNPAHRHRRMI